MMNSLSLRVCVAIISCQCLSLAQGQYQEMDSGELFRAMQDDFSMTRADPDQYRAAVKFWIQIIDQRLASTYDDPMAGTLAIQLSALFERDGQPQESYRLMAGLCEYPEADPTNRLRACLDGARLAAEIGESSEVIVRLTDRFISLVDQYRAAEIFYSPDYNDEKYDDIDLLRSNFLRGSGKWFICEADSDAKKAARLAGPPFELAAKHLRRYVDSRVKGPAAKIFDQWGGVPRLLIQLGKLESEIAQLYDAAGDVVNARRHRVLSIRAYEQLLFDLPGAREADPLAADSAAVQLVSEEFIIRDSMEDFLAKVVRIAEVSAPGPGLPGYLVGLGMDLELMASQIPQMNAQKMALLDAAKAVYLIAMELEERYDPREFRNAPNYQSAIIFAAKTSVALGDLEHAQILIQALEEIEIKGVLEPEWFENVKVHYAHARKKSIGNTLPAEPAGELGDGIGTAVEEALEPQAAEIIPVAKGNLDADNTANQITEELESSAAARAAAIGGDVNPSSTGTSQKIFLGIGGLVLLLGVIFFIRRARVI